MALSDIPNAPDGDFRAVCTMIGLMIIIWARAEHALALSIGLTHLAAGPIRAFKEPPISLKGRLKFIRAALTDVPQFSAFKQEGERTAHLFSELAPLRHKFIHSASHQKEATQFEGMLLGIDGGKQTVEYHSFNLQTAADFIPRIVALNDDAHRLLAHVHASFPNRVDRVHVITQN